MKIPLAITLPMNVVIEERDVTPLALLNAGAQEMYGKDYEVPRRMVGPDQLWPCLAQYGALQSVPRLHAAVFAADSGSCKMANKYNQESRSVM